MNAHQVQKFFQENMDLIGTAPGADTLAYNLNAGLWNLVQELTKELRDVRSELTQLSRQVSRLRP